MQSKHGSRFGPLWAVIVWVVCLGMGLCSWLMPTVPPVWREPAIIMGLIWFGAFVFSTHVIWERLRRG